jgi:NADH-quinone oxidoreductase subunit I
MLLSRINNVMAGLKSIAIGLGITGRTLYSDNVTVIYPKEEVDNLSTFRGHVELVGKQDAPNEPKCVACGICVKACPSGCLTILCPVLVKDGESNISPAEMGPAPQKGSKTPGRFILDFSKCSLCGQCVKACPSKALQYSNTPYMVGLNRKDFEINLIARLRTRASTMVDLSSQRSETVDFTRQADTIRTDSKEPSMGNSMPV